MKFLTLKKLFCPAGGYDTKVNPLTRLDPNGFAEHFQEGKTSKLLRLICAKFISHDKR